MKKKSEVILVALISIFLLISLTGCISENNNEDNNTIPNENDDEIDIYEEMGINKEDIRNNVTIYWFWGEGCPFCKTQEEYMDRFDEVEEVKVKSVNAYISNENIQLIQDMAEAYGTRATGVPMTFIGEKHWTGFSERMYPNILEEVALCLTSEEGCINPLDKI